MPEDAVTALFGENTCLDAAKAGTLIERFTEHGSFDDRAVVERDGTRVQALPVVVVRNRSGEVLRLKRRERRADNPLHEKLVIWAGGHVRREDGNNGVSILGCAVRELQEELRLCVAGGDLVLLGAVWIRSEAHAGHGNRTRRHVAVVFEWRAPTDDVAVVLSTAEFIERRGTSLSGRFVAPAVLAAAVDGASVRAVERRDRAAPAARRQPVSRAPAPRLSV